MHLKFVFAITIALLPYLGLAFYAYLPPGHKGARKNVHIGNQISKGFDQGLMKLNIKRRALPVRRYLVASDVLLSILGF